MSLREKVDRITASKMIEKGYTNTSQITEEEFAEIKEKALKWMREEFLK